MRPSSASVASTSAPKRPISRDISLAARARVGIGEHCPIEVLVLAHRLLEHPDRARERADLIASLAMNHRTVEIARGYSLGQCGDLGQRARNRPADDDGS